MRTILVLFFLIFVENKCTKTDFGYYEGYIYSEKKPLNNLEVFEKENPSNLTLTNEDGFFRLKTRENFLSTFLILRNKNKIIDSIQIIRTSGGEKINYYFIEGRKDTLFIDMK